MPKGGIRPGAGRPPGVIGHSHLKAIKIKEKLSDLFEEEAEALHRAQIDLAKGIFIGIEDPETHEIIRVYKKIPSSEAYRTLLEHIVGRPKQPLEHSGEINLPTPILNIKADYSSESLIEPKLIGTNELQVDNINPQSLEAPKTDQGNPGG